MKRLLKTSPLIHGFQKYLLGKVLVMTCIITLLDLCHQLLGIQMLSRCFVRWHPVRIVPNCFSLRITWKHGLTLISSTSADLYISDARFRK